MMCAAVVPVSAALQSVLEPVCSIVSCCQAREHHPAPAVTTPPPPRRKVIC